MKFSALLFFICLYFLSSSTVIAQDSILTRGPNLASIKSFFNKFSIKKTNTKIAQFAITTPKMQSSKKVNTNKFKFNNLFKSNDTLIIKKMEKDIVTKPYNPIKIKFPAFNNINLSNFIIFNSKYTKDSFNISSFKINQFRKSKIITFRDDIKDIDSELYMLDQKKETLLVHKNNLLVELNDLNNKDSIKQKLIPEIKNILIKSTPSVAIPVGFTDIDEQIRNLQLLNKIPPDNSLTIRPYYTNSNLDYAKILSLIDTNIKYNGILYQSRKTNISLLPINITQKLNTTRPYGWNDGAMSYSKGYQLLVGAGIYISWGNLKLQLKPEFIKTGSGKYQTSASWGEVTKSKNKILPGQSSIRYDLGGISISASTQNLWWGPGISNSMLMSNNAPGFFHYSISSNRPLKTFIGNFQFQVISATLNLDSSQGYEHRNLKKLDLTPRKRAYNALILSYQPSFMKHITFELSRAFQNLKENNISGFVPKYLPVLGSFFGSAYNDTINRDQILSVNTRWLFPKQHAEVYFQFGYNDAKDNFRDLMLDMSHASGYLFGFKKLSYLNKLDYLDFGAEIIRMAQTPSYLMRNAGNFYEHGRMVEGYTHQNQILGAGNGFGNNMQSINLSWNRAWNKYGIVFNHIVQNPTQIASSAIENLGLRNIIWKDFSYGIQTRYRYRNILLNANLEWVNSKNYMWQDKTNTSNFYAFINTIFLW